MNDADSRSRREQILADALRAADRRRRTRALRRVAGTACACLLAVGTVLVVARNLRRTVQLTPLGHVVPKPTSVPAPHPSTNPDTPRVVVQIIPADRVERRWQVIDDDQLIAALAAAGQPGGVASLNGKAVVVPLR